MNRVIQGVISLILFTVAVSMVQSAPPIFLEKNGAKICTLNNVGAIPTGALKYPVYQKVCRHVHSTLGDPINEDEGLRKSNNPANGTKDDEEVEKVRRMILSPSKLVINDEPAKPNV